MLKEALDYLKHLRIELRLNKLFISFVLALFLLASTLHEGVCLWLLALHLLVGALLLFLLLLLLILAQWRQGNDLNLPPLLSCGHRLGALLEQENRLPLAPYTMLLGYWGLLDWKGNWLSLLAITSEITIVSFSMPSAWAELRCSLAWAISCLT